MTQPRHYGPGILDINRDRQHRLMMELGSKLLLDTLTVRHPRIVRLLQAKNEVELPG